MYVIDIAKNVVTQGPIVVRARLTQTVQEYKEQLSLVLNMDPKDMYLVFQPQATSAGVMIDNEKTLQEEGYANASKILVESSLGSGKMTDLDNILDIHSILNGLILLNVPLPDVSEGNFDILLLFQKIYKNVNLSFFNWIYGNSWLKNFLEGKFSKFVQRENRK